MKTYSTRRFYFLPGRYVTFPLREAWLAFLPELRAAAQDAAVDTSAIQGTPGFVECLFDADTSALMPLDASASIDAFAGGTLGVVDTADTVNATGTLPDTVTIRNSGGVNVYEQAITFGPSLQFMATFASAPAGTEDEGSTFVLLLLAPNGSVLPTTAADGSSAAVSITQHADRSVDAPQVFAPLALTPEPPGGVPLALGLLGIVGLRWQARRTP